MKRKLKRVLRTEGGAQRAHLGVGVQAPGEWGWSPRFSAPGMGGQEHTVVGRVGAGSTWWWGVSHGAHCRGEVLGGPSPGSRQVPGTRGPQGPSP